MPVQARADALLQRHDEEGGAERGRHEMTRVVRLGGGVGRRGAGAAGLRLVRRKDVGGTAAGATGGAALEVGVPTGRVAEDLDRVEREVHVGVSEDGRESGEEMYLRKNQALLYRISIRQKKSEDEGAVLQL